MKIAGIVALVVLILGGTPLHADVACYGGGEGPTPMFRDVSSSLVSETNTVYTEGGVRDFVFLEGRGTIFYRNEANRLMSTRVGEHQSVDRTGMDRPLARLVDSEENYLLADGDARMYDVYNDRWIGFDGPSGPMEHLFWFKPMVGREQLFTLGFDFRGGEDQTYRIYNTLAGKHDTVSCPITLPNDYRLVRGMVFKPWTLLQPFPSQRLAIVFYREVRTSEGKRKIVFRAYGHDCNPTGGPGPMIVDIPWEAPLVDAYWFPAMGKIGLQFKYKKGVLVWSSGGEVSVGCNSFDLDDLDPIFVSDSHPILATWSKQRSLVLYDAQNMEKARLMSEVGLTGVDSRALWLNEKRSQLFVSPQTARGPRQIYRLSLKEDRR